jgi:hypothetical protein
VAVAAKMTGTGPFAILGKEESKRMADAPVHELNSVQPMHLGFVRSPIAPSMPFGVPFRM